MIYDIALWLGAGLASLLLFIQISKQTDPGPGPDTTTIKNNAALVAIMAGIVALGPLFWPALGIARLFGIQLSLTPGKE